MDKDKKVLTPLEVAQELGLCRKTVYEMLHKGQLPYIKAGDKYLIPTVALDKYLADPSCNHSLSVNDAGAREIKKL
jgi:excisionase family DNA binding protein